MHQTVKSALTDAVSDTDGFFAASSALDAAAAQAPDDYRPFAIALGYVLVEASSQRRERTGGPFGSIFSGDGWQSSPPLDDLPEGTADAWAAAICELENPIWQARLGDLLWVTRTPPDAYRGAQRAFDAYLTLAGNIEWEWMERVSCATRALELAWELNDDGRKGRAAEAVLALADEDLASDTGGPGVTLRLLGSLLDPGGPVESTEIESRLDSAMERYGADPHIAEAVDDLRVAVAPRNTTAIRERQVQLWRDQAQKASGFLKATWLERALDLARREGLDELADGLRVELQQLSPEDLDLKTVSSEISIPTAEIEKFVAGVVGNDEVGLALARFGLQPPPGGSAEDLESQVRDLMAQAPLQFLVTQVLIGPDSATAIFRADDEAKTLRLAMARTRQQSASLWGQFAADALTSIQAHYGTPNKDAFTALFTTSLIDGETAERIGRAVELYWDGQFDESAHVLIPRLEAVIRKLARVVGIPIVHEPRANRDVGGLSTLGVLLSDLEGVIADEAWRVYLADLLVNPLSLNLRNQLLHGLQARASGSDAALLIHAACWLRLLGQRPASSEDTTDS